LGAFVWEGGEGETFLAPLDLWWVVCVGWFEELGEDGICRGVDFVVPECPWEGDVYFLQSSVRDIVDGLEKSVWERWDECVSVALEPAKWAGHDYFVEGVAISWGGRYGDLMLVWWLRAVSLSCFDAYNGLVEFDVGVCLGRFGNMP